MEWEIGPAGEADVPALGRLYDELNDYLAAHVNHPGWIKGVYPTIEDAADDVREGTAHVARREGRIAGAVTINRLPEQTPDGGWFVQAGDDEVFAVHRLVVHPDLQGRGLARALMRFAEGYARERGAAALRLDVFRRNAPAIRLYESCGFLRAGEADLGFAEYGLDRFYLYEKPL